MFEAVSGVLNSANIEVRCLHILCTLQFLTTLCACTTNSSLQYIKWDMNRPLTQVISATEGVTKGRQGEVAHRYVLGLYELQGRLLEAFPMLLIENSASGGAISYGVAM